MIILNALLAPVTHLFLGHSLPVRITVAILFMGGAGFLMGMPMPTGVRYLKASGQPVIPWAWAINGYFTVVGSALTIILAVTFGFSAVFWIASVTYLLAPLFLADKSGA